MQAALYHDLRAAGLDGFAHLGENGVIVQKVGVLMLLAAEEGAEPAFILADVGVVDIAVNDEGHRIAKPLAADSVGAGAEFERIAVG